MRSLPALAFAGLVLGAVAPARAAGDARAGHTLARQWCSSCHLVDSVGRGTDMAPPFATIAERNRNSHQWVRAWLKAPHPRMPDIHLSRRQIDDIVAYLDSLAPSSR